MLIATHPIFSLQSPLARDSDSSSHHLSLIISFLFFSLFFHLFFICSFSLHILIISSLFFIPPSPFSVLFLFNFCHHLYCFSWFFLLFLLFNFFTILFFPPFLVFFCSFNSVFIICSRLCMFFYWFCVVFCCSLYDQIVWWELVLWTKAIMFDCFYGMLVMQIK